MDTDRLAELLALREVDGVGDKRALELFRAFESGEALRTSPLSAFEAFHYVDEAAHDQLRGLAPTVAAHRDRLDRLDDTPIEVVGVDDDRYPDALRRRHSPLVLYARGNLDRLRDPTVSVSGSRETNAAGREWVRGVASDLAAAGYTVVSGGARGADTAAHVGALDATGGTVVVLGTGVSTPYPEENADLFDDIVDAGGLVLSHRPPDAGPTRHAFLDRNETISALSPGIVIVATDGAGGTQAQYETAVEQGRRVFVPAEGEGISPDDGLRELRSADATTVVDAAADIREELGTQSSDVDTATEGADAPPGDDQTTLGEWDR